MSESLDTDGGKEGEGLVSQLPPTPHYNSAILEDVCMKEHLAALHGVCADSEAFRDAVILGKVSWSFSSSRKTIVVFSGFFSFCLDSQCCIDIFKCPWGSLKKSRVVIIHLLWSVSMVELKGSTVGVASIFSSIHGVLSRIVGIRVVIIHLLWSLSMVELNGFFLCNLVWRFEKMWCLKNYGGE